MQLSVFVRVLMFLSDLCNSEFWYERQCLERFMYLLVLVSASMFGAIYVTLSVGMSVNVWSDLCTS